MSKATIIGRLRIDVTKILKQHIYEGKKGKYLDVTVWDKGIEDEYGFHGFATQEISKQAREAGEKGPILGNWRRNEPKQSARPTVPKPAPAQPEAEDDVPF